jgi:HEAT repeat protein
VAIRTAAAMRRPSLLRQVARALEDPEMMVRCEALEALISYPGHTSFAPPQTLAAVLTEMLNDVNDGRREDVLKSAWRLGEHAPAETMVQMLGDTSDDIRAAAARVLNRTHHDALTTVAESAAAILDGRPAAAPFDSIVHSNTLFRIKREPQPSMSLLEHAATLLVWPYWEVRTYAAQALRPPTSPNLVPPTWLLQLEALAGDPGYPGVQQAAREALERLSKDQQ